MTGLLAGIASQVLDYMSAQRMALPERKSPARSPLWLAGASALLALPLGGCGTGALWDKFTAKDDTFVEEPADKLYNEGLYLMNQRKDNKAASKKFEEFGLKFAKDSPISRVQENMRHVNLPLGRTIFSTLRLRGQIRQTFSRPRTPSCRLT
jgi:hypothetical protein